MENNYDIFISYSRHDLEIVKELKAEIERSTNARCWMDLNDIAVDDEDYLDRIVDGIENSKVFIFMLSEASQKSEHAVGELLAAMKQKKKTGLHVVILNIDDCEMSLKFTIRFSSMNSVIWSDPPQRENLMKTIRKWLNVEYGQQKSKEKTNKRALAETVESVKLQAEGRESTRDSLSPIDKEYKEYGYTIVGCGKSTILKEDIAAISDDLSFVKISESVIAIEKEAFNYSHSQLIVIPKTVRSIGESAFNYVHNIEYHGVALGKPWGALHMNVFIEGDFIYADKSKKEITGYLGEASSVIIPRNVETIGALSFYYCHYVKSVVIPNTVTRIGESAFDGCANLENVECSDSLKYIDWAAFRLCKSLKSIIIPKSVRTIGEVAFYGCENLKTVYLGNPNAIYSKEDSPSFPEHTKIIKI